MTKTLQFLGRIKKVAHSFHALKEDEKNTRYAPVFLLPATLREEDFSPFLTALEEARNRAQEEAQARMGNGSPQNPQNPQNSQAIIEGLALHRATCRVLGHPIPFMRPRRSGSGNSGKTQDIELFNLACSICGEILNSFPAETAHAAAHAAAHADTDTDTDTDGGRHYCPNCERFREVREKAHLCTPPLAKTRENAGR